MVVVGQLEQAVALEALALMALAVAARAVAAEVLQQVAPVALVAQAARPLLEAAVVPMQLVIIPAQAVRAVAAPSVCIAGKEAHR
jgi:hypothetical protein